MKVLKVILIVLASLVALLLIAAAFMKKEYTVERSVMINKSKQEVFDYIRLLKNQDNFSVWNMRDPGMKKTYSGEDGTIGFTYSWEGNDDVGKGEQEIKKITEGDRMDMELRFKKPYEMTNNAFFVTESAGENQTKVIWGFNGHNPYPMNIMIPVMDNMLGKDLQTGLNNLKAALEKQ